jgi:hypothetical protein
MQGIANQRGGINSRSYESESGRSNVTPYERRGNINNESTNVRNLCETPNVQTLNVSKCPKGNSGIPLELIANHFRLEVDLTACYHYDIDIKLAQDNNNSEAVAAFKEKRYGDYRQP